MLRSIGGVVLGYFAIALIVFVGLTVAYLVVGPNGAFRPGVWEVSPIWIAISIVAGFGAALVGGWVARRIGGTTRAPLLLAGVVIVLGLVIALPALSADPVAAGARPDILGPFDAMRGASTPLWLMLLNPLIGAAGVLLGGRAVRDTAAADAPRVATPVA